MKIGDTDQGHLRKASMALQKLYGCTWNTALTLLDFNGRGMNDIDDFSQVKTLIEDAICTFSRHYDVWMKTIDGGNRGLTRTFYKNATKDLRPNLQNLTLYQW